MQNEFKRGAYAERKIWYRMIREAIALVRDSGPHDAIGALKLMGEKRRKSIKLAGKRKGGFGQK